MKVNKELIELKRDILKHYNPNVAEARIRQRSGMLIEGRKIENIKP